MPERKYTTNPECPECNGLAGQLRLVMKAISWGADFSGDRPGRKQGYAYEPLHCRKCLIEDPMPEPEDEVVRDAREAVLTGRASRSDNSFKRILDAYEAAIRASERAKVEALRPLIDAIESAFSRFGEGSMGGSEMSRTERFAVLSEEVGEVAAEVVKEQRNRSREPGKHGPFDAEALIAELTQVAACAVMWAGQERAALDAVRAGRAS